VPPKRRATRKMRHPIGLLFAAVVRGCRAVTTPSPRVQAATLDQRESQVSTTLSRASQFVDVPHISSRPACEEVQPPEALTTPDPLYTRAGRGQKVKSALSSEPMAACTARSFWRVRDSPAIAMFSRRCAPGDIVRQPATVCRPRRKARSSFQPIALACAAGLE